MFKPTKLQHDIVSWRLRRDLYTSAAFQMVLAYLDWKSNARVS